ncbi:Neuronal acetylcholine receptor subunit beta-4 [Branchiostoma belcheri]|nr:Neuronal acetylcholine receptor subunit beta-4 [Branchiostoma belcheri]
MGAEQKESYFEELWAKPAFVSIAVTPFLLKVVLCTSDSSRLRKDLLEFYDKNARPVRHDSSTVSVEFDIALRQIIGLKCVNVRRKSVPSPVLMKIQRFGQTFCVDSRTRGGLQTVTDISVTSDGNVSWLQPDVFKSSCGVDVSDFPFDQQTCRLEFASWIYHGEELDVTIRSDNIDISAYQKSDQYTLTSVTAKRNVTKYDCCPERYPSVVLTLRLKRLRLFYIVNMVIPCVNMLILNIAAFFIPPDSGERLGFTITILLALVVFLQLLTDQLPHTSRATPLLGKYFSSTIIIVTISILATILVIRLSLSSPPSRPLPRWLRLVLLKYVATFLCLSGIAKTQKQDLRQNGRPKPPGEVSGVEMRATGATNNDQQQQSLYPGESPAVISYMQRILGQIREIANSLSNMEFAAEQQDEWKMAALVLDRVVMILTTIASAAVSLGLLLLV